MKISSRSRYGIRFMMELAERSSDRPVMLREIAEAQDISEKYLSQIVIPLKKAGLIKSSRGAKGGYFIGLDPAKITMMDLILLLEDNFYVTDCLQNPASCKYTPKCASRHFWATLQFDITKSMRERTLADLVALDRELCL